MYIFVYSICLKYIAQAEISNSVNENMEKTKMITGLLDGGGDYTLVYEDSEGDRMLVGDVPWQ